MFFGAILFQPVSNFISDTNSRGNGPEIAPPQKSLFDGRFDGDETP